MDYEKKYKEALANARQEYNTTENIERKQWLEELFPELKESEPNKVNITTTIGDSWNPTAFTEKDYSEFAQHTSSEDLYPHKEYQGG